MRGVRRYHRAVLRSPRRHRPHAFPQAVCVSLVVAALLATACRQDGASERAPSAVDAQLEAAFRNLTEVALRAGHESGAKRTFAAQASSPEKESDVAALAARAHYDDLMPRMGMTATQRADTLSALGFAYGLGYEAARRGQAYPAIRDRMLDGLVAGVLESARR